eukprot:scaffold30385_cov50-Skeletonema_dohrnii-CCMP3373.AAC.1
MQWPASTRSQGIFATLSTNLDPAAIFRHYQSSQKPFVDDASHVAICYICFGFLVGDAPSKLKEVVAADLHQKQIVIRKDQTSALFQQQSGVYRFIAFGRLEEGMVSAQTEHT